MTKHKKYIFIVFLFLAFGVLFFYNKKSTVKTSETAQANNKVNTRLPASAKAITKNEPPNENHTYQEEAEEVREQLIEESPPQDEPLVIEQQAVIEPAPIEENDNNSKQNNEIIAANNKQENDKTAEAAQTIYEDKNTMLIAAPQSLSDEIYEFDYYAYKHPVKLKWSDITNAKYYEVEVTNTTRNHKYYFKRSKNKFNIMLYPNEDYKWRVLPYNNLNQPMTYYSRKYSLRVNAPTESDRSLASEEAPEYTSEDNTSDADDVSYLDDDNLSDDSTVITPAVEAPKSEPKKPLWSKFWVRAGTGGSVSSYNQSTEEASELSHTSFRTPHIAGEAGAMITKKLGITATAGLSPGRLIEENSLFDTEYTWSSYSLEALYLIGNDWDKAYQSSWYVRIGANIHSIPVLAILPTVDVIELVENNQISLGAGVGKKTLHGTSFSSNLFLNAQIPVSATTSEYDYELDGGFIFSGHLGLNYQLNKNFNLGLYWQGKLLFSSYYLSDGIDSINGSQFLINNNLGFYLGFEY